MTEAGELEADLRSVWEELYGNSQYKNFDRDVIVLGIYIQRLLKIRTHPIEQLPPRYAIDFEPRRTARTKAKPRVTE